MRTAARYLALLLLAACGEPRDRDGSSVEPRDAAKADDGRSSTIDGAVADAGAPDTGWEIPNAGCSYDCWSNTDYFCIDIPTHFCEDYIPDNDLFDTDLDRWRSRWYIASDCFDRRAICQRDRGEMAAQCFEGCGDEHGAATERCLTERQALADECLADAARIQGDCTEEVCRRAYDMYVRELGCDMYFGGGNC